MESQIKNFHQSERLGMDVNAPAARARRRIVAALTRYHTWSQQPTRLWFREGSVVGYSLNHIKAWMEFKETDWKCDNDYEEPSVHPHGGFNPPEIKSIGKLATKTPVQLLPTIGDRKYKPPRDWGGPRG